LIVARCHSPPGSRGVARRLGEARRPGRGRRVVLVVVAGAGQREASGHGPARASWGIALQPCSAPMTQSASPAPRPQASRSSSASRDRNRRHGRSAPGPPGCRGRDGSRPDILVMQENGAVRTTSYLDLVLVESPEKMRSRLEGAHHCSWHPCASPLHDAGMLVFRPNAKSRKVLRIPAWSPRSVPCARETPKPAQRCSNAVRLTLSPTSRCPCGAAKGASSTSTTLGLSVRALNRSVAGDEAHRGGGRSSRRPSRGAPAGPRRRSRRWSRRRGRSRAPRARCGSAGPPSCPRGLRRGVRRPARSGSGVRSGANWSSISTNRRGRSTAVSHGEVGETTLHRTLPAHARTPPPPAVELQSLSASASASRPSPALGPVPVHRWASTSQQLASVRP